jgi:hypothetical protein
MILVILNDLITKRGISDYAGKTSLRVVQTRVREYGIKARSIRFNIGVTVVM